MGGITRLLRAAVRLECARMNMNQRWWWLALAGWVGVGGGSGWGQVDAPLLSVERGPGTVRLTWPDQGPGVSFVVQGRQGLGGGLWLTDRSQGAGPLAGVSWTGVVAPETGAGFFRVAAVPTAVRGMLLTNVFWQEFTPLQLGFLLGAQGIPVTPQYGVRVRKVVYETLDAQGARTVASGVLALPTTAAGPLPLVSYQHGTLVTRAESPSANLYGETMVAVVLASTGYAAVVPDYLGFGESPGYHPYHHAASTATAGVDLLRATRVLCETLGVVLTNRLFLCGYSQGGHATMALHRELETYHADEFTVTAAAPMAGAYDLSGTTVEDFLSGRSMPNPYYFAYFLAAYQSVYRLTNTLGDLLAAPYDQTLPPLLDGAHGAGEINAAMPSVPTLILKPEVLAAFRGQEDHVLRVALRDNDAHRWAPRAPVRLFHCSGDLDVAPANGAAAREAMLAAGAGSVEVLDPSPGADHGGCSMPSLLAAKAWFDSLR